MSQMRKDGHTITSIAKHFGISKQRVSEIFRLYNQPLRITATDDDIRAINNPERIADTFGISVLRARERMKRLGLYKTQPHKGRPPFSIWTKDKVEPMYQDYQDGMTQANIAVKYGIKQSTVSMLFIKHGFRAHKGGWPKGKPRKV